MTFLGKMIRELGFFTILGGDKGRNEEEGANGKPTRVELKNSFIGQLT